MKAFLKSLLAAAIGGAITSIPAALQNKPTGKSLGLAAASGAAVAVAALWKQPPQSPQQ